jgi:hypothetical protein
MCVTFLSKKKENIYLKKKQFERVIFRRTRRRCCFWLILSFAAKAFLPNEGEGESTKNWRRKKGGNENGITRVYRTLKKLGANQKQI